METNRVFQGLNKQAQKKNFEKPDEESFFKVFGKIESPFGDFKEKNFEFEFLPKSRTYSLRNLPYTLQANKFQEFKNDDLIKEALDCSQMRYLLKAWLQGR